MSTALLIVILVVLFAGGGYWSHRSYGTTGLGGMLGLVLALALILWLLGALGSASMRV